MATDEDMDCNKRFWYLMEKKQHFWNTWCREYLVDLREFHRSRKVGKLNRGWSSWKIAVVEELVKGNDDETRGARVRVILKGKAHCSSQPVQKLFP